MGEPHAAAFNVVTASSAGILLACASAVQAQDAGHSAVSEVVVTASPLSGDPDRFATIVEQVSRDQVLGSGGASIADALRNIRASRARASPPGPAGR